MGMQGVKCTALQIIPNSFWVIISQEMSFHQYRVVEIHEQSTVATSFVTHFITLKRGRYSDIVVIIIINK